MGRGSSRCDGGCMRSREVARVTVTTTLTSCLLTTITMPRGKRYSDDLAWSVVTMASTMSRSTIKAYTGMSIWQISRICSCVKATGKVSNRVEPERRGHPKIMNEIT